MSDDTSNEPAPIEREEGLSSQQLDTIATELADVESALARLDGGSYWTDEISGRPLPEDLLIANPTARSAAG